MGGTKHRAVHLAGMLALMSDRIVVTYVIQGESPRTVAETIAVDHQDSLVTRSRLPRSFRELCLQGAH